MHKNCGLKLMEMNIFHKSCSVVIMKKFNNKLEVNNNYIIIIGQKSKQKKNWEKK